MLDTHLLLWVVVRPARLTKRTRALLDRSAVSVSAASIWELAIKRELGKIDIDPDILLEEIPKAGLELLPISPVHAALVAKLPPVHRDPFDRLLVCQAAAEGLTLLTNDELLTGYGPMVRIAP